METKTKARLAPYGKPRLITASGAARPEGPRWIGWLLPVLCLAVVAAMCIDWLPACDLWWQLKTGELIWTTHTIPHRDVFSHTAAGQPWYVQEWLTEVLLYALYRWVSPEALVLYKFLGAVLAFGLVLWRSRLQGASTAIAVAVTVLGAYTAAPFFDMRPQMLTYGLCALALLFLDQWRRGHWPWAVWLFPAIALLWVNLHAGFLLLFVALGVEIAAAAGECVIARAKPASAATTDDTPTPVDALPPLVGGRWSVVVRHTPALTRLLTLVAAALLCGLAGLVNPNGLDAFRYPFHLLLRHDLMTLVMEWSSPNFHLQWTRPLVWLLMLLAVSLTAPRRDRFRDLLLMGFLAHNSLFSVRHMPIFAIACAPVAAAGLEEMRRSLQLSITARRGSYARWAAAGTAVLVLLLAGRILIHARAIPRGSWFEYCAVVPAFPTRACDYLLSHPLGSRLYNHYPWGGYCIWRLWPRYRVAIDGRAEVYVGEPGGEEGAVAVLKGPREDLLRRWNVDTVLLPADDPFAHSLASKPEWRAVYQDEQAVVLQHVPVQAANLMSGVPAIPQEIAR